jgi:hypothetical protein
VPDQIAVERRLRQQLCVGAEQWLRAVEYQDSVGPQRRADPVRDDDQGAGATGERLLDACFSRRIQVAGRLVEDD